MANTLGLDVALWLLLVVIVVWLFMGACWPTRQGNGEEAERSLDGVIVP